MERYHLPVFKFNDNNMVTMKLKSGATLELSLDDALVVMVICSDLVVPQHRGRMPPRRLSNETVEAIKLGLQQVKEGKVKRMSFVEYADMELDDE